MRLLTLLDRYIIKELIGSFFYGMTAFTAILAGSSILIPLMNEASKYSIPVSQVFQLFIFQLPGIIVFTFPMAMLLTTILTFGRMSGDLEILAFRASGISFFRLVIPALFVGLMVSFITIWFNEAVVPVATHNSENLINRIKKRDRPNIRTNINITEYDKQKRPLRIINVQKVDKGALSGVTVLEYEDGELVRAIKSDTGSWLPTGGWEFYDGVMYNFISSNRKKAIVLEFEKEFINIRLDPNKFRERKKDLEEMNAMEMRELIQQKRRTGEEVSKELVRYHMRFSVPFASLIFTILGASVGVRPHRSSSAIGLGISLIIIVIYYVLLGVSMGLTHLIDPVIIAWLPNTVVGIIGLLMLQKTASQ